MLKIICVKCEDYWEHMYIHTFVVVLVCMYVRTCVRSMLLHRVGDNTLHLQHSCIQMHVCTHTHAQRGTHMSLSVYVPLLRCAPLYCVAMLLVLSPTEAVSRANDAVPLGSHHRDGGVC